MKILNIIILAGLIVGCEKPEEAPAPEKNYGFEVRPEAKAFFEEMTGEKSE